MMSLTDVLLLQRDADIGQYDEGKWQCTKHHTVYNMIKRCCSIQKKNPFCPVGDSRGS